MSELLTDNDVCEFAIVIGLYRADKGTERVTFARRNSARSEVSRIDPL